MVDTPVGDETAGPLVWRSLTLRLAIAAIPLWLVITVLVAHASAPITLILVAVFGVTLASPVHGLLLVALLAPLGDLIAQYIGAGPFRIAEAIVVTFLAGWLLRALPDRRGPRAVAPAIACLFAVAIIASMAGLAWQLGRYPRELTEAIDLLEHAGRLRVGLGVFHLRPGNDFLAGDGGAAGLVGPCFESTQIGDFSFL